MPFRSQLYYGLQAPAPACATDTAAQVQNVPSCSWDDVPAAAEVATEAAPGGAEAANSSKAADAEAPDGDGSMQTGAEADALAQLLASLFLQSNAAGATASVQPILEVLEG